MDQKIVDVLVSQSTISCHWFFHVFLSISLIFLDLCFNESKRGLECAGHALQELNSLLKLVLRVQRKPRKKGKQLYAEITLEQL